MPSLQYAMGSYRRANGDLPELRLVNMFVEATPADDEGAVLLSRKGLTQFSTPGSGPIRGMFKREGVFNGDLFTVSGTTLYRNTTSIGTVPGSGPVSFASSGVPEAVGPVAKLFVNAGDDIKVYNGTTLTTVSFPDSAKITAIAFISGLYVALRKDTHTWYWSGVLNGASWGALDYASAESAPDKLMDIVVQGDTIWLFGTESTECWQVTGATDIPFRRIEGRVYTKGVIGTGAAVEFEGQVYWVGNDGGFYGVAEGLSRLSDGSLEERIRDSATVGLFAFKHEGHPFICLRLESGVFAYDTTSQNWSEFTSEGFDVWRVRSAVMYGPDAYLGDDAAGKVWTFDGNDDDGADVERLFTVLSPIPGGTVIVDEMGIDANVGRTSTGEPMIEMRSSRDGGETWGEWRETSLGTAGQFKKRPRIRRWGTFAAPAAMFELRYKGTQDFRMSGVYANETGGGRARP